MFANALPIFELKSIALTLCECRWERRYLSSWNGFERRGNVHRLPCKHGAHDDTRQQTVKRTYIQRRKQSNEQGQDARGRQIPYRQQTRMQREETPQSQNHQRVGEHRGFDSLSTVRKRKPPFLCVKNSSANSTGHSATDRKFLPSPDEEKVAFCVDLVNLSPYMCTEYAHRSALTQRHRLHLQLCPFSVVNQLNTAGTVPPTTVAAPLNWPHPATFCRGSPQYP
jgi:hypothetical protein